MSKLRSLTYGVGGGIERTAPSKLLEWTDDDRIVLHTSPEAGPSGWDVPVAELRSIGGLMGWLRLTPRDGDVIRVHFADPNLGVAGLETCEIEDQVANSDVKVWAKALRDAGVPSSYVSMRLFYLIGLVGLPVVVIIVAIVVTTVQRFSAGG